MRYPTVSVIVLNYNNLEYLEDCCTSLSQLDYPSECVELVLADNASTDGSVEFVHDAFPHVRILQFDRNHGFCAGNNLAASQTSSEFIAFLNPDMRVEPHWLAGLVEALDNEPEAVCASSKILNWDGSLIDFGGTLLQYLGHGRADGYRSPTLSAYDHLRYILAPCGGAMLIDRQVFLVTGGFDEDYVAYFEDIDLGWRLWILGYKVVFAPQSVCYHVHFGSFSKQPEAKIQHLYERNALYTIIKNYEEQYLAQVLPLALLLQAKRAYLFGEMSGLDLTQSRFELEAPASAARTTKSSIQYYSQKAWHTLRTEGPAALWHAFRTELKWRRRQPASLRTPSAIAARQQSLFWIQQAHITAVNDVVDQYAVLLDKRTQLQEQRRRSDRKIFGTVRALSFDVCMDTAEYRHTHQRLMELFSIEELFGEIFDPDLPFAPRREG
jgi:GT2 family glycosyltransferase